MAVFPPPAPGAQALSPPPRATSTRFWAAVAMVALAAGVGAWVLTRPGESAAGRPAAAEHTVESRPLEADAGAAGGDLGPADTLTPGDPQSIAPGQPVMTTAPAVGHVCTSALGWSLTVPDGWYESGCRLFSPWPITETDPTLSDAPVQVSSLDGTWEEVIVVATPEDRRVIGQGDATVAGRRALVVSSVQTEPGWFDTGTAVYEIWVDDGGRVVIITAWAAEGDVSPLAPIVDRLAASLAL